MTEKQGETTYYRRFPSVTKQAVLRIYYLEAFVNFCTSR